MSNKLLVLARGIYPQFGLDEEGIHALQEHVLADPNLVAEVVRFACLEALKNVQYETRQVIAGKKKEPYRPKTFTTEQQNIIVAGCGKWLNWPMMNGTLLKNATKEHLLQDIQKYRNMYVGHYQNMRFLEEVANKLKDGQTVGEVLTDKQLTKIRNKVTNSNETK